MMEYSKQPAFINREPEMNFLRDWIAEKPENLLFIYGPKSSGKTTLLYKFVHENISGGAYDIKHINLRKILIVQYQDFIKTFFEIDYSKTKADVREKREYDLKVFKLSVEVLKGLEAKEIDPFAVMEKELRKANDRGIRPVIIIDELQALEGIYLNSQRELLKELFNFFVAMTKESHLCHVLIASSDGYFIERIYNDSKLKKTSKFLEVDYLSREDVYYWLNNLEKESAIKKYTLTPGQIERIWETFGGSCWEISRFLGDILMRAEDGKVPEAAFADELRKVLIQMRSLFVDYARLHEDKRALFSVMAKVIAGQPDFNETELVELVSAGWYKADSLTNELNELVRQNFLAYDPTAATYAVQGRSMEIGLAMFAELIKM